ncbi:hypothetical protein AX774_g7184 [Zancudomyces culisetae]|uniref:Uncharacterized protein n=1 Tax=Zancudomyces culisetae TaxID=1213189 RepID=A0A1R1PEL4_ZANCU|nr:hypothetical protein AX774_g7184 [Zancudomyces culisetae]|eukprot:OMH79401.1 hypothetical protein AX774_g7184 [Zancudomyces culisetae]
MRVLGLSVAVQLLSVAQSALGNSQGQRFNGYVQTDPSRPNQAFLSFKKNGVQLSNRWLPLGKVDSSCKGEDCYYYAGTYGVTIKFNKKRFYLNCDYKDSITYRFKHTEKHGCCGKSVKRCNFKGAFREVYQNKD